MTRMCLNNVVKSIVKTLTNNDSQLFECSKACRSNKPTFTRINPGTKLLDNEDVEGVHLVTDFDLVWWDPNHPDRDS
jgi:hypothetical protein